MRKLIVLALLGAAAYFAWTKFGPTPGPVEHGPDSTPAANMKNRIDSRSGVAPD
jgi:hypothetical protein